MPAVTLLHPWEFPQKTWFCINLDYAGPCEGKMFLITVDEYSIWLDVHHMNTATSSATIGNLRRTFAEHDLHDQCMMIMPSASPVRILKNLRPIMA